MSRILLIDDDPILTKHYKLALQAQGFTVEIAEKVSTALSYSTAEFDMIVCDLMMEDEGLFQDKETNNGIFTGLRYVESLREEEVTVPCVILTNLNLKPFFDELQKGVEQLEDVVILRKADFDPIEFSRIAAYLVRGEQVPSLSASLTRRLADSLILQPNFSGLGIDLRKLFGYRTNEHR